VEVKTPKRTTPLIDDYHLLSYESIDSTNAEARRLAEGGGAHGAFIWAHSQSLGRGRKQRDWISQPGNLFVSALLKPECEFAEFPQLSYIAAVASYASVAPLLDEHDLALKWPNDLFLNGKKLAGILCESFETENEQDERSRWLTVGLGMNIESAPKDPGLNHPAICLKDVGVELISAKIVLSRFIHHFIEWYQLWQQDGFETVSRYWVRHCLHQDETLTVLVDGESVTGQFVGLDQQGDLRLMIAGGEERLVSAGEVIL
jgi:BirA family biotin operon repressor/biotin-[acetyl-CoA-carboxylase] ligase